MISSKRAKSLTVIEIRKRLRSHRKLPKQNTKINAKFKIEPYKNKVKSERGRRKATRGKK